MDAAVIREGTHRIKFKFELRAAVEDAGIPHPRRIARRPGSGAMKTGIPDPLDRVARFDGDKGGRKIVAAGPDVNVEALGLRTSTAKEKSCGNQAESDITREHFHSYLLFTCGRYSVLVAKTTL